MAKRAFSLRSAQLLFASAGADRIAVLVQTGLWISTRHGSSDTRQPTDRIEDETRAGISSRL